MSVLGYYFPNDFGGGDYYWDNNSTETDNGGTVIQSISIPGVGRWKRIIGDHLCVNWFGAKGDGGSDDTIPIQNAIDLAAQINVKVVLLDRIYSVSQLKIPISKNLYIYSNGGTLVNSQGILSSIVTNASNYFDNTSITAISDLLAGASSVELSDTSDLEVGDIIWLYTTEIVGTRLEEYLRGDIFRIKQIIGNVVALDRPLYLDINKSLTVLRKIKPIENLIIEGITFSTTKETDFALQLGFLSDSLIYRCKFVPLSQTAYANVIMAGYSTLIKECYAERAIDPNLEYGYGFALAGVAMKALNCTAVGCKHGFTTASRNYLSSDIVYENCKTINGTRRDYDYHGGSYNGRLLNCESYNCESALELRGIGGFVISGLRVWHKSSALLDGLRIYGEATGTIHNVSIFNCEIHSCPENAMLLLGGTNIENSRIENNRFYDCNVAINFFTGNSYTNRCSFGGNIEFNGTGGDYGLRLRGSYNRISNNRFDNHRYAIEVNDGQGNIIENNICVNQTVNSSRPIRIINNNNTICANNDCRQYQESIELIGTPLATNVLYLNQEVLNNGFADPTSLKTTELPADDNKEIVTKTGVVDVIRWLTFTEGTNQGAFIKRGIIQDGVDLDTLLENGVYVRGGVPTDWEINHYPTPNSVGNMLVFRSVSGYLSQLFTTKFNRVFFRMYLLPQGWNSWIEFQKTPAIDVVSTSISEAGLNLAYNINEYPIGSSIIATGVGNGVMIIRIAETSWRLVELSTLQS